MTKKSLSIAVAMALGSIGVSDFAFAKDTEYKASIDIRKPEQNQQKVVGFVFEDLNRDGKFNRGEPGIPDVMVSNGKEVVLTDYRGKYKIKKRYYREDMNIFVSKPACFELPVDENNVPQFAYVHKENGSTKDMLFGGLEPTGKLPKRINFPLIKGECKDDFKIAVSGDPQPYSNIEVGYVRDTIAKELADRDDIEAVLVEGDVMGDDLGLMPRFLNNMKTANAPQFLVLGNHDVDLDSDTDADSSDTFRRIWGPQYYSFTVGKVHFVILDNVTYPCDGTDLEGNADDRWSFCSANKTYTGRISDTQLEWLKNDLAYVPDDHLIVVSYHIPTVSFVDSESVQHSEDNVQKLYEILGYEWDGTTWTEGRPALALSGHTHTNDQFRPGELFDGWTKANHPFPMPFPQIIAGAACGSWWSGDFNDEQIPESYQRLGAPKGYFLLSFSGNQYRDEFKASGKPIEKQMNLSFNSPDFRAWFDKLKTWYSDGANGIPPVNANNLGDNKMLKPSELGETNLVINVWNGSRDSQVRVQFDDGDPVEAVRTQTGTGESVVESLDPFALRRQLSVVRTALKSTETDENQIWNGELGDRSDGYELWNASMYMADSQLPLEDWMWTVSSNHIWTVPVPDDLAEGVHRVQVHTTDIHGQGYSDSMVFEVRTPNESILPEENDPTDEKYDRQDLVSPL